MDFKNQLGGGGSLYIQLTAPRSVENQWEAQGSSKVSQQVQHLSSSVLWIDHDSCSWQNKLFSATVQQTSSSDCVEHVDSSANQQSRLLDTQQTVQIIICPTEHTYKPSNEADYQISSFLKHPDFRQLAEKTAQLHFKEDGQICSRGNSPPGHLKA